MSDPKSWGVPLSLPGGLEVQAVRPDEVLRETALICVRCSAVLWHLTTWQ